MKPEQIRGGGFAGGTFTGAPNVDISSPLRDLSKSLGIATEGITKSLAADYLKGIDDKKKIALDEAEIFEQTTAGYTSEKLRAEIESEPMLAKFKENPYLLPAINVYRGRKQADELALQMVEAGVDTGDADGVRAFYEQNAPDLNDPFFARGFNEQNARLQAQFSQQQLAEAMKQATTDRVQATATVWRDVFFSSGGDATAAYDAVMQTPFGKSVEPGELTRIQMEFAQQLAVEGNVDMLSKLATSKRGTAPTLSEDVNTAADIARLTKQAEGVAWTKGEGARNAAQRTLMEDVSAGRLSKFSIKSSPMFAALAAPGQKDGEFSDEQMAVLAHTDRVYADLQRKAEMEAFRREQEAMVERLTLAAQSAIETGGVANVRDIEVPTMNGGTKTITAASQIASAVETRRDATLGENPWALSGDEAKAKYGDYFGYLARTAATDKRLSLALGSMTSGLFTEDFSKEPEAAVQALTMWRSMPPSVRDRHKPSAEVAVVLEMADRALAENPKLSPESALRNAVTRRKSAVPRYDTGSTVAKEAAAAIRLPDPSGERTGMLWWQKGKTITPEASQVLSVVTDKVNEGRQFGMSDEDAKAYAVSYAQEMFVSVNGVAVKLPEKPDKRGLYREPREFANDVSIVTDAMATKVGIPPGELSIVYANMQPNLYSVQRKVVGEDGTVTFEAVDTITAEDIAMNALAIREKALSVIPGKPVAKAGNKTTVAEANSEIIEDDQKRRKAVGSAMRLSFD